MPDSTHPQDASDVLKSDFDHETIPELNVAHSTISDSLDSTNEKPQAFKQDIEISLSGSISTDRGALQQDTFADSTLLEEPFSIQPRFSLNPDLIALVQDEAPEASCFICGQTGCACTSNQSAEQQQNDSDLSGANNLGNTFYHHLHDGHNHSAHSINGLAGDFPVWNTVANTNIAAQTTAPSAVAIANTFNLHSNPNAQHTIYLDFDGHTTSGTWWNNGGTIESSAYDRDGDSTSFSTSELLEIQSIWQQVAEDFAPFNVNVTTRDPGAAALSRTHSSDGQWGVRVLFTDNRNDLDDTPIAAGAGGVAYIGSFNRTVDQPVFVFNKGARAAAVTASHEVGHSLYLNHDGIAGQTTYHPGHGSGATSWGSILGAPFQESLTQWSRGDYYGADNTEDDLAIITTRNGFGYRADDHGNNQANATTLVANDAEEISAFGIIERNTDVDYFSFSTGTGDISLTITPASRAFVDNGGGGYSTEFLESQGANLDIGAGLYNASGQLLQYSNPSELLTASFDLTLAAGNYFIRIDGVGKGDPFARGSTGYSDYGSLGQYSIAGTVTSTEVPLPPDNGTFAEPIRALNSFGVNAGGWSGFDRFPRQVADINGDGNADIIGFGSRAVYTALSNGDGTFAAPIAALNSFGVNAGGWSSFDRFPRQVADINGDGNADIIGFGNSAVFTALSNGDGTFAAPIAALNSFGVNAGGWSSFDRFPRQVADINGDGNADIIGFGNSAVFTALSNGDGTFAAPIQALNSFGVAAGGWSSFDRFPRQVADINGDGNADIIGFGNSAVFTALSNGDGTFAAPIQALNSFGVAAGGWSSFDRFPRQVADINGDGNADIIGFGNSAVFTALSNGDGTFAAPTRSLNSFGASQNQWSTFDQAPRQVADINGDGSADIIGFGNDAVYTSLSNLLTGTTGNAPIVGASSDDPLTGTVNADTFLLAQAPSSRPTTTNEIRGFNAADGDLIEIEQSVYGISSLDDLTFNLTTGELGLDGSSSSSLAVLTEQSGFDINQHVRLI